MNAAVELVDVASLSPSRYSAGWPPPPRARRGAVELWMAVWPIGGHRSPCIAGDGKKWRHGEPINAIRFSARQSVSRLTDCRGAQSHSRHFAW